MLLQEVGSNQRALARERGEERKSIFHDYFVLKRFVKYRGKRKQIYHFACRLSFSITCYHHLRFHRNAHQITYKQYRVFHRIGSVSRFKRYRRKSRLNLKFQLRKLTFIFGDFVSAGSLTTIHSVLCSQWMLNLFYYFLSLSLAFRLSSSPCVSHFLVPFKLLDNWFWW